MARDLVTALNDSAFAVINGYDASTDKPMYNNFPDVDTLERNEDNWMHDLVGATGIPPLNNKTFPGYVDGAIYGGILLTPRHMMFTRHAFVQPNSVIYFYGRDNTKYTRTITHTASPAPTASSGGYSQAYGDYYIALLDSDLPSDIEPLKVFPPDLYKYFKPSEFISNTKWFGYPNDCTFVSTDQEEKSILHRISTIEFGVATGMGFDSHPDEFNQDGNSSINFSAPYDSDLQAWYENKIAGDSGSPNMALIDDELIFLGVTSTTGDFDSITNLRSYNDVNRMIVNADASAGISTGYSLTQYNMAGFKQYNITDREYTYIGNDISNGTLIQYRGSVTDHNSYHYSIPYAASSIVRTDPRDNSQTFLNVNSISTSTQKWVGAAYASNKRIYAAPHAAYGPLIIDTTDPSNVTVDTINVGYGLQTRGIGLLDNGNGVGAAYLASYSGSESTKKFTFDADGNESAVTTIPYTVPESEFEDDRSNQYANDIANYPFIYRSFWGAVNGGNNKMYVIPYGSSRVQVIDLNDDSVSFISTELTGLADMDTSTPATTDFFFLRCPQWNKYKGGVLASNGCIYTHGTHARGVLKIDTSNDTVTEVPYPHTLVHYMTAGYTGAEEVRGASWGRQSASLFSVLGPDGKVYNTPWNLPFQISIDPTNDSIAYQALSSVLDEDASGADLAWYTDGSLMNQQIFMAPGEADRVLEIGFDGYSPAAYSSVTPYSPPAVSPSQTGTPTPTGTGTPTPTQTNTPTQTPTNGNVGVTPTPTASNTQTPTPQATNPVTPTATPSSSRIVSPSPTQTGTPTNTPTGTGTPTPTQTKPNTTGTPTPTISHTQTGTPTPTQTPTVTPTNNNDRCVRLTYDVEDGPDRFIVKYKGTTIIDTGFVGNAAYVYGGYKRQVFVDALVKEGLDFTGTTLADDGYPVVDTVTEGFKESIQSIFNETDAYVTIQSPVHDKPGWTYTLNCPMMCVSPTPTQTATPTGTSTPTPTQTSTTAYVAPSNPSATPTGTATPTPTPTSTPQATVTFTPSQTSTPTPTGTATPTASPSVSPSISNTPSGTPSPSVTPSPSGTPASSYSPCPSPSVTSSVTPSPTPSPSKTPSPSPTPSSSGSPSPSPPPSPSVTPSGSGSPSPSSTPAPSPSGTPAASSSPDPSSTPAPSPSGTPAASSSPDPSSTPAPSPSGTPAASSSPDPSSTPAPSPSGTPAASSSPDPSSTPAPSPSGTPAASSSPDPSSTPAPSPSGTPAASSSPDPSSTPAPSPTPTPSPSQTPTYSLVSNFFAINEGETVVITLTTTAVADGTLVPYTITGIDADDIAQPLTGNFTVNNNQGARFITAVEDSKTEGTETMLLTLDGPGTTISVAIIDSSRDPSPTPTSSPTPSVTPSVTPSKSPTPTPTPSTSAPGSPTYSLTSDFNVIYEGNSVTVTLNTTNVADGTNVPYAVSGISSGDITQASTGNFTINGGTDSAIFSAVDDGIVEGTETMRVQINGAFGDFIDISILDNPVDPSPTPSPTPSVTPSASLPGGTPTPTP